MHDCTLRGGGRGGGAVEALTPHPRGEAGLGTEAPLERRRRAAGRAEVEQAWSRPTRPPSAPSGPRAAPPRPSTVRAAAVLPPAVAAAPIGAAAAAVLARIACGVVVAHTRCRTHRADADRALRTATALSRSYPLVCLR